MLKKKKKILVSLPIEIIEKLEKISRERGIPKSMLITIALYEWLEKVEKTGEIKVKI